LQEVPGLSDIIFTTAFTTLIHRIFGEDYFVVRSIYFNKPGLSNWFVAYHQDLSISVNGQYKMHGFKNWTNKQGQWAVQPPAEILENMFTIRIHLDDTDEYNGALKVIPGSHKTGMRSRLPVDKGDETICRVAKGGIMLMKPLLLHSSAKTTNNQSRRVIHVEFSNRQLPAPLAWREAMQLPAGSFL
jgi:ectoine hydroxylase-related dioxygenase (phytanoyl-CoA dioxygenase family)